MNSRNRTGNPQSNPTPEANPAGPDGTIPFDKSLRARDWGGILVTLIAVMIILFAGTPTFLGNLNICEDCCDDGSNPGPTYVCCENPDDGKTIPVPVEDCCDGKLPDEGEECCNDQVIDLEEERCCLGEVGPLPDPNADGIELDYTTNFNEESLPEAGIRGKVEWVFDNSPVSCDNGTLVVEGEYEFHMYILKEGHDLFKYPNRYSQYNHRYPLPRTDAEERQATIDHEYDHFWTAVSAAEAVTTLNGLNGNCCNEEYAECLNDWYYEVMVDALAHSHSFHDSPTRLSGNQYFEEPHPFIVMELHCSPPDE